MAVPPSLRQVAQKAGVSQATASRALANKPEVSPLTRERVLAVAREMGYHPDPVLSSVASRRFSQNKEKQGYPIAFLFNSADLTFGSTDLLLEHLPREAEEYGYRLEVHDCTGLASLDALFRSLSYRNVAGLILGAWRDREELILESDLSSFSVIECCRNRESFGFEFVHRDVFAATLTAFEKAREDGCKNIGFALHQHIPSHPDDRSRHAAALECLHAVENSPDQAIFTWHNLQETEERGKLINWLESFRPDGVIGFPGLVLYNIRHLASPPHPLPAFYNLHHTGGVSSGVMPDAKAISHMTMDLLDQAIRSGRRGRPERRQMHLVEEPWFSPR